MNGDGLLVLNSMQDTNEPMKMMRLLLTDSGHYILPTDHQQTGRVSAETQCEVAIFCSRVATTSSQRWDDVDPRVYHVFTMNKKTMSNAEGDRSEEVPYYAIEENMVNFEDDEKDIIPNYDKKIELAEEEGKGAVGILPEDSEKARDEPHVVHDDRHDLPDQPLKQQPCGDEERHLEQTPSPQRHVEPYPSQHRG